jgi:hypothetical protein
VGPHWDRGLCGTNEYGEGAGVGPKVWFGVVGYNALCPNGLGSVAQIRTPDSVTRFHYVGLLLWSGATVGLGQVWVQWVWDEGGCGTGGMMLYGGAWRCGPAQGCYRRLKTWR